RVEADPGPSDDLYEPVRLLKQHPSFLHELSGSNSADLKSLFLRWKVASFFALNGSFAVERFRAFEFSTTRVLPAALTA
ncbi:MAG TPA: hypothetical protein VKY85_03940, partial [Candidatus Angelobacter sp.]|nr:hypothetical protein [Candidatus Angelobacter sp.]